HERDFSLEVHQVGSHPATQAREAFTEVARAPSPAHTSELFDDPRSPAGGVSRLFYRDRHGLTFRCFKNVQRFLKTPGSRKGNRQLVTAKGFVATGSFEQDNKIAGR